jgi:phosphoribosylformylglycinamidine synthase
MIHKYQAKIYVTLRPSVLDPSGTAVESGLHQLGYESAEQVRIGKYIELQLKAENQADAEQQLDAMCDQLLANPVIENYRFELEELAAVMEVSMG